MATNRKRKAENTSTGENISRKIKTSPSTTTNASILDAPLVSASFYIKDIGVKTYSRLGSLKRTIRTLRDRLLDGKTETQYYAFTSIPKDTVDRITDSDSGLGRSVRVTYFRDEEVMVVKLMPCLEHQVPFHTLAAEISCQVYRMGIGRGILSLGATTFKGQRIYKEADASYKPYSARPNMNDWPTLLIVCGCSESLQHLRNDAMLWISESRGEVKIVVVISVDKHSKTLQIEKWCDQPSTLRRSPRHPRIPGDSPKQSHTITISHIPNTPADQLASWNVVNAPLILEFNQIFLRNPVWTTVSPETDVSLTAAHFQTVAARLWC